ncbi:MAG: hypothetical protein AAGF96_01840 [Bacteroidota bacterium]
MENLKVLDKEELQGSNGGGFGTGGGSLFRSSLYTSLAAAHAAYDFVNGFVDRIRLHSK